MSRPHNFKQDYRAVVATAGTRQTLTSAMGLTKAINCTLITVQSEKDNGNDVMIGGPAVVAAVGVTARGYRLGPNEAAPPMYVDDTDQVFLDSINNGDGVHGLIFE